MKNENEGSNEIILLREDIEGTPFTLITTNGDEGKKYFISMGNYRLSPISESKEEIETYMELNWNNIANMIICLIHSMKQINIEEFTEKTNYNINNN